MIGVGEHDSEMAKTATEQWHANEPGSHFVCFKNAGHIVNLDTPEEFNDELDTFMRRA
jgi:pimeloyl-ACP methyl ester carboxylesterase